MKRKIELPFVTSEVEFFARYSYLVNDVLSSERNSPIGELTWSVVERTISTVDANFRNIEESVSGALSGIARVGWVNTNRGRNWECWGRVYGPMGPKRRIGSIGFMMGDNEVALRLQGWFRPRWGGLDGRRWLVQKCRKRFPKIFLQDEFPERLPGEADYCGIIWLDYQLSTKSSRSEVLRLIARQSRMFVKTVMPLTRSLKH